MEDISHTYNVELKDLDYSKFRLSKKPDVILKILRELYPGKLETVSNYLNENEKIAQEFLDNHFYKTGIFEGKLKMYCEFMDKHRGNSEIEEIISHKIQDNRFKTYYGYYGTAGCRTVSYHETNLKRGMMDATKEDVLGRAIYSRFQTGEIHKKEIKEELTKIYQDLGLTSSKPKASDLSKYFSLTRAVIPKGDKRSEGFMLGEKGRA